MIINLFKIFFVLILLYGCGFKVQNQSELKNYYIKNIVTSGDNRINFNIKNKLLLKTGPEDKETLNLTIKTKKTKSVKEKNNKNIITKYIIRIDLDIIAELNGSSKNIILSDERDFNVGIQYSETIKNEKQTIKDITDNLIDKIIREISIIKIE